MDCLNCNKPKIKRPNEDQFHFWKRKFCSRKCSREYQKKNKIGWYSPKYKLHPFDK